MRIPRTIWRYATSELWRLVLLSTASLVSVIAFAAAIKPLADGDLDPPAALLFMFFAVPPMLAYALPFAAGFAATLSYHRMAQDNEVTAALAGGISHRTLLVPALFSGILLAGGLGLLNDQVIPRFLSQMERMVTRDVAQLFVRQISGGNTAMIGNMEIHAKTAARRGGDPGQGVIDQLRLTGVALVETDDDGAVVTDATSREAMVFITPGAAAGFDEGSVACTIQLIDVSAFIDGEKIASDEAQLGPFRVPDAFEDDPKFLTGGELARLHTEPESMSFVESRRWRLARSLALRASWLELDRALRQDGRAKLEGTGGLTVVLTAGGVGGADGSARVLVPNSSGVVAIEEIRAGPDGQRESMIVEADTARIALDDQDTSSAMLDAGDDRVGVAFRLDLEDVRVRRAGVGEAEREVYRLRGLKLSGDPMVVYGAMRSAELLQVAADVVEEENRGAGTWAWIEVQADDLRKRIARLGREIVSKQHERLAYAAACLVMVVTGAVTALRLRSSPPLVVYLWSFFPALLTVLMISMGQQHAHSEGLLVGIPMLWSGVVLLAGYAAVLLADLSRH